MKSWQFRCRNQSWFLILKWSFLLSMFSIFSCSKPISKEITPAFYHWKTNFEPTDFELKKLDSLSVQKLYVKFFDVDWDFNKEEAIPKANVRFKVIPDNFEIVPTIFITNRTLENISEEKLTELAFRIDKKIFSLTNQLPNHNIGEIQLDCDWSLSTKDKFFELTNQLNLHFSKKGAITTATIRLHQIKFFEKTGVPPVDRGMLMFYNMGDLENWNTENSILDLEIGRQYFQNFDKYPLDLDIALPIFQWGILYRDGKMIRILNNLKEEDLKEEGRFRKINQNRFQVIKSTYLNGHYLYQGDLFRLESINQAELKKSAKELTLLIQNPEVTMSFYHLDSLILDRFSSETLNVLFENNKD